MIGNGLPPGWFTQGLAKVGLVAVIAAAKGLILRDEVQTEDALPIVKNTVRGAHSHLTVASWDPKPSRHAGRTSPTLSYSTLLPHVYEGSPGKVMTRRGVGKNLYSSCLQETAHRQNA